jgi:trehalose synthase
MIALYDDITPKGDMILLRRLGDRLSGKTFLHVNSTRVGGGVAEILQRMVPLLESLGITVRWEVIEGDNKFYTITKKIHNTLQGYQEHISEEMWDYHFEINRENAGRMDLQADAVLIHDPQPAPLVEFRQKGHWIWRCHIDASTPQEDVDRYLRKYWSKYDAAIYSVAKFARSMDIGEYIIPPSIDPLSEKNRELSEEEIEEVANRLKIPRDRPIILQVSRFDRFKDPLGVIRAFQMVRKYNDCCLVLAGSPADDDPEGSEVLQEVQAFKADDPDIHLLLLPAFSDRDINALQRMARVVLQKSIKEGFGLTVSEAMWKKKPVIGGAVGGIPQQIIHGVNGFLVHSIEGAAFRIRHLLNSPAMAEAMGEKAREYVRTHFLITRQMRDYLSLWYSLDHPGRSVIEL